MSSNGPRFLACDPGFSAFGYSVVEHAGGRDHLLEMGVILTKPAKGKVLKTEDSFRRLRETCKQLKRVALQHDVVAIVFESQSIPQSTSKQNAIKIGHPYGSLAMLAEMLDIAVVMRTPQAVKKYMCGVANASKEDVELATAELFGQQPAAIQFQKSVAAGQRNHAWDSLAAYLAAGETDVMRALKRSHG